MATEVGTKVAGNTTATKKYRSYMITINNPEVDDEHILRTDKHKYLMYQIEKGENGTQHIQAVIYYATPRSWPKARYPRAHIEPTKDIHEAIKYCSKNDTRVRGPYEFGEKPAPGRRTDLEKIAKEILDGETIENIALNNPSYYVRYSKGLKELKLSTFKDRTQPPQVFWFWGTSGTGKTAKAIKAHKTYYIKDGSQWWDGYEQQEAIIIDDYHGRWEFRDFLRLLDENKYQGQVKGGYVKINSPFIYITCEFPPKHYYGDSENELEQVTSRIDEIREFKKSSVIPRRKNTRIVVEGENER